MRKLLIILTLLSIPVFLFGQNTTKMNSIKRSTDYIYAEATMENAEEAYEVATDLLLIQVREYVAESEVHTGRTIRFEDIRNFVDSLHISRGDMMKTFLYVKKSDIPGGEKLTLPVQDNVKVETVAPKKPEIPHTSTSDATLKLEVSWQQDVIDRLLTAGSYSEARAVLSRLKSEFKIKKTGPMMECKNPAEVYLLVGKEGSLVTVLGPGEDSRTDFKSLTKTSDTYDGYDKVWFTFSK